MSDIVDRLRDGDDLTSRMEAADEIERLRADRSAARAVVKNLLMHLECLVIAIDPDDCGIDTGQAERAIAEAIPAIIERDE